MKYLLAIALMALPAHAEGSLTITTDTGELTTNTSDPPSRISATEFIKASAVIQWQAKDEKEYNVRRAMEVAAKLLKTCAYQRETFSPELQLTINCEAQ